MKKSLKPIALFLTIAMTVISLCSCRALDDAKANQAVYLSAEHNEIEYKGHIYRKIDSGVYTFLNEGYGGNTSTVSEKDTPVLLASEYGDWMYVDNDEIYIKTSPTLHSVVYYAREDRYDAISKIAQAEKLDSYYLEYHAEINYDTLYWEEYNSIVAGDYHVVKFGDDVTEVINNAMNTAFENKISYKELG